MFEAGPLAAFLWVCTGLLGYTQVEDHDLRFSFISWASLGYFLIGTPVAYVLFDWVHQWSLRGVDKAFTLKQVRADKAAKMRHRFRGFLQLAYMVVVTLIAVRVFFAIN